MKLGIHHVIELAAFRCYDEIRKERACLRTCISMNCPFIEICKDYNFLVDREKGCKTQNKIIDLAAKEVNRRKERPK